MILSLFKVALLTLSTSLFSFSNGTSSQNNDLVPQKERSLINPSDNNFYYDYNSETDYYLQIDSSDINLGQYVGFTSEGFESGYRIHYEYFYNNEWVDGYAQRVGYVAGGNLYVYINASQRIRVGLYDTLLRVENSLDNTENYSIDSVRLYYYNASVYKTFLSNLIAYTPLQTISYNVYDLLTTKFYHLVDFFKFHGENINSFIKVNFNLLQAGNEYYENKVIWADDDYIQLHLTGDYIGVFDVDSELIDFNQNVVFKGVNGNIWEGFVNAFNLDVGDNVGTSRYSFTFAENFNFNSPYGNSSLSLMVYSTDFDSSTNYSYIRYELPMFESNGRFYRYIELTYANAYHRHVIDEDYNVIQVNDYNYGIFVEMRYYYADSTESDIVFQRISQNINQNGTYYNVPTNFGLWVNKDYQTLNFIGPIYDVSDINKLSNLNDGYGGSYISYTDNYLGETFDLVSLAYNGIWGLMSHKILPGVSIGVLILVPFAITMILFVIHLFKR